MTSSQLSAPLRRLYALTHQSGLLERPLIQKLFLKSYFFYKRHLEDPYARLVRDHPALFSGGHILDIGANVGYTAEVFASTLSSGFRVFAFEPEEINFRWLTAVVADRGLLGKVVPVRTAVGDRSGEARLWLNPDHHADHRMVTEVFRGESGVALQTQPVSMIRVDDFCAQNIPGQPVAFIKIDVQGFEACVCSGMAETLSKHLQTAVGVEYDPEAIRKLGYQPADVPGFFRARGYSVYVLNRSEGLRATPYESLEGMLDQGEYTDLVFLKSDRILDERRP